MATFKKGTYRQKTDSYSSNTAVEMFAINPDGKVIRITLLNVGDYDNDGKSELIFQCNGYNKNGYIFFYDQFSKKAEFLYSYH